MHYFDQTHAGKTISAFMLQFQLMFYTILNFIASTDPQFILYCYQQLF